MPDYVLATDSDFSDSPIDKFLYIGNDDYVELPHIIKGVDYIRCDAMFANSSAKGVSLTKNNVGNMMDMFYGSSSTSLDLSSFDTSGAIYMSGMFGNSKASILDLTSFDTSNVVNMQRMFSDSEATLLDLSSFDMSGVYSSDFMFENCQATTGYARTQEDADILNATRGKPDTLTFTLKPPPSLLANVGGRWVELATKEYADEKLGGGS